MKRRVRLVAIASGMLAVVGLYAGVSARHAGAAEDRAKMSEAARKEGEVTLATSGPAEQYSQVLRAFEQKHPGIKANLYRNPSAKIIEKFLTEKRAGKAVIDVMQMTEIPVYMRWKKEGLLLEYRSPEGESMPAEFKDPGFWYSSRFAVMAIVINTKYVPKDSIKSYTDLAKPEFVGKWKGKVTGSDPRYRGSGLEQYFALRERHGADWWKPFAKLNIKWATGSGQEESWLASGEVVASIGLLTYRAAHAIDQGVPLEIVWPAEGAIPAPTAHVIVSNAPHPNAAKLLSDFLLSTEGQKLVVDTFTGVSFRPDATMKYHPPFNQMKFVPVDYEKFSNTDREGLLNEWRNIFGF
jgi:iron(III) transport system substrate-binding protein